MAVTHLNLGFYIPTVSINPRTKQRTDKIDPLTTPNQEACKCILIRSGGGGACRMIGFSSHGAAVTPGSPVSEAAVTEAWEDS